MSWSVKRTVVWCAMCRLYVARFGEGCNVLRVMRPGRLGHTANLADLRSFARRPTGTTKRYGVGRS